jgi:hypothetical protein
LIYEKDNAAVLWGKMVLSINSAGSIGYPCGKKEMLIPLLYHRLKKSILYGASR